MSNNPVYRLLVTILLLLPIISSCGPATKKEPAGEITQQAGEAQNYMDSGNYLAAAEIYRALAEKGDSEKRDFYRLQAAQAYIAGADFTSAGNLLDQLNEAELSPPLLVKAKILSARTSLADNSPRTALDHLDITLPDDASRDLLADYYQTRAEAHALNDQPIAALQDRDKLYQFQDETSAVIANADAMWALLNQLSTETLTNESYSGEASSRLVGWYDLALIRKTRIYDQATLQQALEEWKQQYPGHPAAGPITADILELAETSGAPPEQIALLLPFSDSYRDASSAIREGFLAAWFESTGTRPAVLVYDSSRSPVLDVYRTAINDGADIIVGPLQKDAVAELISSATVDVTTLALNQLQDDGTPAGSGIPDKLYQFGLLPEEEAAQAAERAWSEGHANALIITPDNNWGDRIYAAFADRWQKLGGQITEHVMLSADTEDYSTPVKQLLNVDKSEERTKRLVSTLSRNIVSEPRHRRDADMIFLAVTPVVARQLVPQFRFYRAGDIPFYATSSIYSGNFDPQANADLDQVMFADMPWILETQYEYSPLQRSLNHAWNQSESGYRRLYALGIDAYQILPELGRLRATSETFEGKTGSLTVSRNNIIHRNYTWAKFVKGSPRLLDEKTIP